MGFNPAEEGVDNELINRISALEAVVNDLRTNPQPIGNGSLNYAVSGFVGLGPVTIGAGATTHFQITFIPNGSTLTYNGREAIKRWTLMDIVGSLYIDNSSTASATSLYPIGTALSSAQVNATFIIYCDYTLSSFTETAGQRVVNISIRNNDTTSHVYYARIATLIPRPALKPL